MVRLQENNGQFFVTIPVEKVKRKKWRRGQEFDFDWDPEGRLVLVPIGPE